MTFELIKPYLIFGFIDLDWRYAWFLKFPTTVRTTWTVLLINTLYVKLNTSTCKGLVSVYQYMTRKIELYYAIIHKPIYLPLNTSTPIMFSTKFSRFKSNHLWYGYNELQSLCQISTLYAIFDIWILNFKF